MKGTTTAVSRSFSVGSVGLSAWEGRGLTTEPCRPITLFGGRVECYYCARVMCVGGKIGEVEKIKGQSDVK